MNITNKINITCHSGDHPPSPWHSLLLWRENCAEDWSKQHNMSTRKAKYHRADRATQHTGRRSSARKAIEARWKKAQQPLTDITNTSPPLGSRILDLENLGSGLAEITTHSGQCGGMCVLDGETRQAGLASALTVKCVKCGRSLASSYPNM